MYKLGYMCEPAPDADSIAVANGLIQAIPAVVDVTDPVEKQKLTELAYRISRALIGNKLAERFDFPKTPRHRNAVPLPDEATPSANVEGRPIGPIGQFYSASPNFRERRLRGDLRDARPRKALHVESMVSGGRAWVRPPPSRRRRREMRPDGKV